MLTFLTEGLLDFLILGKNLWVVSIATSMDSSENLDSFLPPILGGEPSRTVRHEEETAQEDESREHLNAPGDTEGRFGLVQVTGTATNLGSAELDEVLTEVVSTVTEDPLTGLSELTSGYPR